MLVCERFMIKMAYFGKEFSFDREENVDELVSAVGALAFLKHKPSQVLEKDGDSYKLILKSVNLEVAFTPGVPFAESFGNLASQSTITVDGDTYTLVQDFGENGVLTSKREYSGNELKVTFTSSKWDGVAYRYFKA